MPAALPGYCHSPGNVTCFYKCHPNWRRACPVSTWNRNGTGIVQYGNVLYSTALYLCSTSLYCTVQHCHTSQVLSLASTSAPQLDEPAWSVHGTETGLYCTVLHTVLLSVLYSVQGCVTAGLLARACLCCTLWCEFCCDLAATVVRLWCARGSPGASECPDWTDTSSQGCVTAETIVEV